MLLFPERNVHPAAISTDSALRFFATGYQCAEVAFDYCVATREVLLFLGGAAREIRAASKSRAPFLRAKADFLPTLRSGFSCGDTSDR